MSKRNIFSESAHRELCSTHMEELRKHVLRDRWHSLYYIPIVTRTHTHTHIHACILTLTNTRMNMCVCAERVFRHAYVVERRRSTKVFEGINIPFAHANTLVLFKGAYPRIRQKDVNDGRYWNEHDAQGKQKQLHGERLVLEPGYSRIPHAHQMLLTAGVGDKLHTRTKCQARGAKALV